MKIGIIGVGIAGANILRNLLEHENFRKEDEIVLFEKRDQLGVGLAYEEDSPVKSLNIPHTEISLDKKNPDDFSHWLEENVDQALHFEGLASRVDCGHYIEDRMAPYFKHKQVQAIHEEVSGLYLLEEDGKYLYKVVTDSGYEDIFDMVFLCLGHPIYNDFYDLAGEENYIQNPYPMVEKLAEIKENKKVGIIGSGPTGIDIYRYLAQEKNMDQAPVFLIRSDIFNLSGVDLDREEYSFSFSWNWIEEEGNKDAFGYIPLATILNQIKEDFDKEGVDVFQVYEEAKDMSLENQKKLLEENNQDLAYLVKYFEKMVPFYPALYGRLGGNDRLVLKEDYEPILNLFRSFNPPGTNQWIIEEIESGHLEVFNGLYEIEASQDGFLVKGDEEMQVDVIINATGFNKNLVDNVEARPLLKSLFDQNLILSDSKDQGILVNWPQCQVMNKKYGIMDRLYVQGMWISNTHYRNNDIRSILTVSEHVAKLAMDRR